MRIASPSFAVAVLAVYVANAQPSVSDADRAEIQALAARYSQALFSCD